MRILCIPDTQVKEDIDTSNLRWISNYIVAKKPDMVIHLGDHWDMPSLSSYDYGKKSFEGRRYIKDIDAGNKGIKLLTSSLTEYNDKARKNKEPNEKSETMVSLFFLKRMSGSFVPVSRARMKRRSGG